MFSYFTPVFLDVAETAPSVISGGSVLSVSLMILGIVAVIAFMAWQKGGTAHAAVERNGIIDEVNRMTDAKLKMASQEQTNKEQSEKIAELQDRDREKSHLLSLHYSPKN